MAGEKALAYLPVGVVVSMLAGAVWINSALGGVATSVAILSQKMNHYNEISQMRFQALEARTLAIEQHDGAVSALQAWARQVYAANPDMPKPDIP